MTFLASGLGDVGGFIGGVAAGALALIGLVTAIVGLRTYGRQGREKRGRWLTDIQLRFVSEPGFRMIRREIYIGDGSRLASAIRHYHMLADNSDDRSVVPLSDREREMLVALDDYLEFFALIERLIREKELREDDAYTMFGWYVTDGVDNEIWSEIDRSQPLVKALRRRFKGIEIRQVLARRHGWALPFRRPRRAL